VRLPSAALGLLIGLFAATVWGAQAVVARSGVLLGFGPLDLSALRFAFAAAVLAPFAWHARQRLLAIGLPRLLLLSLLGGFGNALLFAWGLTMAPASHGGTIAPITSAVAGAVLAVPLLREWPTGGRVAALLVIVAGVLMIGWDGIGGAHPGAWRGDIVLFVAGCSWGGFTVLLRRWSVPALAGNAAVCVLSAVVLVPPWLLVAGAGAAARLPWEASLLQGLSLGILSSAVATTLYARATELMGATRAACLTAMVPAVAVILSAVVLAEPLGAAKLAGVTLAVAGMVAAVLFTGRRRGG
jgi:drug/metabolite transporter (DMT)-like permease